MLLISPVSLAAGLDCSKAGTPVEKMICADAQLRAVDATMSEMFGKLRSVDGSGAWTSDQRHWLRTVRDSCASVECLKSAYSARNGYLQGWIGWPQQGKTGCSVPAPAATAQQCQQTLACAQNADYSSFQMVQSTCTADDQMMNEVKVYRYAHAGAAAVLVWSVSKLEGGQQVVWNTPDRNGFAELDVEHEDECGTGPNCAHDLYHYDPAAGTMAAYFSGGYTDLSYFDGYLLESGRASCCSTELHAYRIRHEGSRDVVDKMAFAVEQDLGSDTEPAKCRYFVPLDQDPYSREVKPPDDRWYQAICGKDGTPP